MGVRVAVLIVLLVALVRVGLTLPLFSQTADEAIHVQAGLQWLSDGLYDSDVEHPPLARIGLALDSFAAGLPYGGWDDDGVFLRPGKYERHLAFARAPNLLFLAALVIGLAAWARLLFGDAVAVVAAGLVSLLPPILAHAGLATTDIAAAATVTIALFTFSRWLRDSTWWNATAAGAACGLGLLSKFSFVIYFPLAASLFALAAFAGSSRGIRHVMLRTGQLLLAASVALLFLWSGYRFSWGTLHSMRLRALPADSVTGKAASYAQYPGYEWVRRDLLFRYGRYVERYADWNVDIVDWAKAAGFPSPLAGRRGNTMAGKPPVPSLTPVERVLEGPRAFWQRVAFRTNLPFPEYLVGLERLRDHSANGHLAFLLGTVFDDGRWYYFPVVLFFKTPLAFLVLAVGGAIGLGREAWRRRRWEWMALAIAPLAMLLPTLATAINIGVRHLLPIYPLLSISGAWMLVRLWQERGRRRLARMSAALLVAWLVTAGATAHPHYLAYFNEAAGRHPERIAVDSNLDWGQDLLFLIKLLEEKKIEEIHLSYWGRARWENLVPQAVKLEPETMVTGWIAISENNLVLGGPDLRGKGFRWLRKHKPVGRAGKSIRLYYVPPVEY